MQDPQLLVYSPDLGQNLRPLEAIACGTEQLVSPLLQMRDFSLRNCFLFARTCHACGEKSGFCPTPAESSLVDRYCSGFSNTMK